MEKALQVFDFLHASLCLRRRRHAGLYQDFSGADCQGAL
jgi:hypothetical protein